MPKLDLDAIPQSNRTGYPAPFDMIIRRGAPETAVLQQIMSDLRAAARSLDAA